MLLQNHKHRRDNDKHVVHVSEAKSVLRQTREGDESGDFDDSEDESGEAAASEDDSVADSADGSDEEYDPKDKSGDSKEEVDMPLIRKTRLSGSSIVVTIPSQLVEAYGINSGDLVEITPLKNGEIKIKKIDTQRASVSS